MIFGNGIVAALQLREKNRLIIPYVTLAEGLQVMKMAFVMGPQYGFEGVFQGQLEPILTPYNSYHEKIDKEKLSQIFQKSADDIIRLHKLTLEALRTIGHLASEGYTKNVLPGFILEQDLDFTITVIRGSRGRARGARRQLMRGDRALDLRQVLTNNLVLVNIEDLSRVLGLMIRNGVASKALFRRGQLRGIRSQVEQQLSEMEIASHRVRMALSFFLELSAVFERAEMVAYPQQTMVVFCDKNMQNVYYVPLLRLKEAPDVLDAEEIFIVQSAQAAFVFLKYDAISENDFSTFTATEIRRLRRGRDVDPELQELVRSILTNVRALGQIRRLLEEEETMLEEEADIREFFGSGDSTAVREAEEEEETTGTAKTPGETTASAVAEERQKKQKTEGSEKEESIQWE